MYEPDDELPFQVGDTVRLPSQEEAVVIRPGGDSSGILIVSGYDCFATRMEFNTNLCTPVPWRDSLEAGQFVKYRSHQRWYPCHVKSVHEHTVRINPVLTHILIELPKHSFRLSQMQPLDIPAWTLSSTPDYVIYKNMRYSCYHATSQHYCVDTRHGRAYFPKHECLVDKYTPPAYPIHIGTVLMKAPLPLKILERMDSETLLEVIVNANPITHENPLPRALQYLMDETFAMHTFRPWSPQIIGDHFDLAVQLGDPAYVQQLLDIALNYVYANQSHRLAIRLRSRKLIGVTTKIVENNMIAFRITWNHHIPRASTMSSTRAVFRALETEPRPLIRLRDPYAVFSDTHPYLKPYQVATLVNMCRLDQMNISKLFTYRVGESQCNDYTGVCGITSYHGGGCLAADVGLGKTVMICALIQKNPALTLIVVPVSLLAHWEQECKLRGLMTWVSHGRRVIKCPTFKAIKHFASSLPKNTTCPQLTRKLATMYAFRPMSRDCSTLKKIRDNYSKCHRKALKMCGQSCIITTAAMLRVRYNKFFAAQRVVIDEAHRFKSANTATVKRIHTLLPQSIWCVTATPPPPITLAKLLNITPGERMEELSERDCSQLGRITLKLERSLLEECGHLQRIPELNNECMCEPSTMYQRVFPKYTDDVLVSLREGDFNKRAVRQMVADLEQMCIHTDCVPLYRYGTKVDVDTASLDRIIATFKFDDSNKKRVKDTIAAMDTCALCLETYERPTVTSCGHVYCRECVTSLKKHTTKCPQCRCDIDTFLELDDNETRDNRITHLGQVYTLPENIVREEGDKVKRIETILKTGHTVVFSRHANVIKYLGARFDAPAITGKTSKKQHQTAISTFEKKGVLFITERSADIGLSFQKANNIVFVEPVWNSALKKKMIGRVKRVGRTKPIHIWTLRCRDSIDVPSIWEQCSLSTIGPRK